MQAHLHDPGVRVVEVDVSRVAYDEWHIDGAVLWNVYADLKDPGYQTADAAALQRLVTRSGIRPDSTVVFYGYAPAMGFWLMKLYGHADVRILDCSRDTWRGEGHPCSSAPAGPATTDYVLPGPDGRLRADHTAVRDAIGDPATTILDVRSWDEYRGERFWPSGGMEPGGRPGHIPSAVHQPAGHLYDERGSFRDDRRTARDLPRRRTRPRRADHLLHDRRPGRRRLVRPHLPARTRSGPRLRRILGGMGPDAGNARPGRPRPALRTARPGLSGTSASLRAARARRSAGI